MMRTQASTFGSDVLCSLNFQGTGLALVLYDSASVNHSSSPGNQQQTITTDPSCLIVSAFQAVQSLSTYSR